MRPTLNSSRAGAVRTGSLLVAAVMTLGAVTLLAPSAQAAGPLAATSAIGLAEVPDAPTDVVATGGDASATVVFTAPADNGSPITGYTVLISTILVSAGDTIVGSRPCAASPCQITGLDNGTSFTFLVVATNAIGDSDPSEPSNAVVPAANPDAPTAPTALTAVSQDGAASLRFSPPGDAGALPITGYEYSLDGGESWLALTTAGTGDPYTAVVSGLTNGTPYAVQVRAVSEIGGGTASPAVSVTPATVPGAPRVVEAIGRGAAAVVTWVAPASDGGSAIVDYTVTSVPGGATCTTTALTCTVSGLTAGGTYRFSVVADNTRVNASGTGVGPAALSAGVTLVVAPSSPTGLSGVGGDRTLTLTWSPPGGAGSSAVTGYAVSLDNGRSWATARTSGSTRLQTTVRGVRKAVTYPVRVRAASASGAGAVSARVDVTIPQWFRDPVSAATRAREVAVPRHPKAYHGKRRHTVATARARDGGAAFPGKSLHGRQLQSGEAVSLSSGAMFRFNKTKLLPAGRRALRATVASLTYVQAVTCEGYADYGGRSAWERRLSAKRARVVCSALRAYGADVATSRVSYGSTRPVIIGGSRAGRAANRRVVIDITRG